MTHTLHRQGQAESLRGDFVVFTMSAKTVNSPGSGPKMKRFFEILEKHHPVNCGDMKTGNRYNVAPETIYLKIHDRSIIHFVFTDPAVVERVMADLKAADLGLSVIVSGLVEVTDDLCRKNGLKMHTVEYSGGVHGRVDLLPEPEVLEVTTMCGHGMVAFSLVREMARQVRKGKRSLEAAAEELAKPCQCGVFNPVRAAELLARMVG